jgi:hypothetical protein
MSRTAISAELARKKQGGAMSLKEFTKDENKLSIEEIANEIMSNFQYEGYDANLAQDIEYRRAYRHKSVMILMARPNFWLTSSLGREREFRPLYGSVYSGLYLPSKFEGARGSVAYGRSKRRCAGRSKIKAKATARRSPSETSRA